MALPRVKYSVNTRLPAVQYMPAGKCKLGTCYQDAYRFILKAKAGTLVHGSIVSEGKPVGHAWVILEDGEYVYEPQTGEVYKKKWFYDKFKAKEIATYPADTAMVKALREGSYGPWEEKAILPQTHDIPVWWKRYGNVSEIKDPALQKLVREVPQTRNVSRLAYVKQVGDRYFYLEGWCDKCLTGTGFPPMEGGETERKLDYIADLSLHDLPRKAKEYGLELIGGGMVERYEEYGPLYTVTFAVMKKSYPGAPEVFKRIRGEIIQPGAKGPEERAILPATEVTDAFNLGKELDKLVAPYRVEVFSTPMPKFTLFSGEIDDKKKKVRIMLWPGATKEDALAVLAHEYAHIDTSTGLMQKGQTEVETWQRGASYAEKWGIGKQYRQLARDLAANYEKMGTYPRIAKGIREWLKGERQPATAKRKIGLAIILNDEKEVPSGYVWHGSAANDSDLEIKTSGNIMTPSTVYAVKVPYGNGGSYYKIYWPGTLRPATTKPGITFDVVPGPPGAVYAHADGQPIGTLVFSVSGKDAQVFTLNVIDTFQRTGIGSEIYQKFEEVMRKQGVDKVTAYYVDSPQAEAFWKSLGFERSTMLGKDWIKRLRSQDILPATGKAQDIWMITREEFIKQDLERYRKDAKSIGFTLNEGLQRKLSAEQHEKTVRKAVAIDKPVPPEVLKDYPDLQREAILPGPEKIIYEAELTMPGYPTQYHRITKGQEPGKMMYYKWMIKRGETGIWTSVKRFTLKEIMSFIPTQNKRLKVTLPLKGG